MEEGLHSIRTAIAILISNELPGDSLSEAEDSLPAHLLQVAQRSPEKACGRRYEPTMNEVGAKQAVQRLLQLNENDIFFGIIQHDVQRSFEHITGSTLPPATGYYYAAIDVTDKRKRNVADPINDVIAVRTEQYRVNLTLVDYIGPITGETELFEQATDDFNTVTDRILELIDPSDVIAYFFDEAGIRYRLLPESEVYCENTPNYFPDAEENIHASMLSEINFEIERC